jgi:CRISPR-associated endonuclease/helicase Cas3
LAFMKLQGYREERLNWKFMYSGDLSQVTNQWKVQVLTGIEIWQPENPWASGLNKRLKTQGLVSYVIQQPANEVRQRLRLPMHFQIYPIGDRASLHEPVPPYSIAFGQSALLLDTLSYRFKTRGGKPCIF